MLCAVFVQMAGNRIVDVPNCDTSCTLMAFVTTAIEDRRESGFVWLKVRAMGMPVEMGWRRKCLLEKNHHTARSNIRLTATAAFIHCVYVCQCEGMRDSL